MNYELKHVKGIPYYIDGTIARIFDLHNGHPSEHCTPIGTYHADTDRVEYYDNWKQLVESQLADFRHSLISHARDTLRDTVIKPQKQRKTTRNPRKPSTRTKNSASV